MTTLTNDALNAANTICVSISKLLITKYKNCTKSIVTFEAVTNMPSAAVQMLQKAQTTKTAKLLKHLYVFP